MDAIYCPLTVRDTGPDADRMARLYDTLRHKITLDKFDKENTLPGFYIHGEDVVEVFRPPVPIAQRPVAAPTLLYELPPVRPEIAGFSTVQPLQSLPAAPRNLRPRRTAELHMRLLGPAEIRYAKPRAYMMQMAFGDRGVGGGIVWDGAQELGGTPLKFHGMIDMGSCANVWMYSNYGGTQEINAIDGTRGPMSPETRTYFLDNKARLVYNQVTEVSERIKYANGVLVDVRPVTRFCGFFDYRGHFSRFIPEFTLGAAIAFTPSALEHPFDGIIGLGRSHPGTSALRTPGVLQQLVNQHCIQEQKIIVCCRYDASNMDLGYGFISFGGWPIAVAGCPNVWETVFVAPTAKPGQWVVELKEIVIELPGQTPWRCKIERLVVVDNATFNTILPLRPVKAMENYIDKFATDGGKLSLLNNSTVKLVFSSVEGGEKIVRSVRGSARKFFIVPELGPGHGTEASTLAPIDTHSHDGERSPELLGFLGLNFFRTFYVGFVDDAKNPGIMLAPQE